MTLQGPATEKQKDYLLSLGYTGDVEKLSKQQASLIIDKLVAQRDERERQKAKSGRRFSLVPTSLGCLVIVLAPFAFAWLLGMLPWQGNPESQPVADNPIGALPTDPPPENKPIEIVPPGPVASTPDPEPEPPMVPIPNPDPIPEVPEPEPAVDPRRHTFVDVTGQFKIEARLKSVANGVATLEELDGQEVKIPLEKLSEESAQWIRDFVAGKVKDNN